MIQAIVPLTEIQYVLGEMDTLYYNSKFKSIDLDTHEIKISYRAYYKNSIRNMYFRFVFSKIHMPYNQCDAIKINILHKISILSDIFINDLKRKIVEFIINLLLHSMFDRFWYNKRTHGVQIVYEI